MKYIVECDLKLKTTVEQIGLRFGKSGKHLINNIKIGKLWISVVSIGLNCSVIFLIVKF